MNLAQLSPTYDEAAKLLRGRLHQLRLQTKRTKNKEELWRLKRRMAQLTPMLSQMTELSKLTAHYYERGYHRNEKYTL